jgi:hypothetical protein
MDPYKYTFKFLVGKNGENRLVGECGFDENGEMLFKITETSAPFNPKALSYFQDLIILLKKIYSDAGGFRNVTVQAKDALKEEKLTPKESEEISVKDPIKESKEAVV